MFSFVKYLIQFSLLLCLLFCLSINRLLICGLCIRGLLVCLLIGCCICIRHILIIAAVPKLCQTL